MVQQVTVNKASALIQKGYQVVPIEMTNGVPLVKEYRDVTFTIEDAKGWRDSFEGAGLAVICGRNDVYCLDFDIDDPDIAEMCRTEIEQQFIDVPIRYCNPNRFAALFGASDDLKLISNGHSDKFKFNSKLNCIELLGNKLATLYGEHRETKNQYKWKRDLSPLKIPTDELPVLDVSDIEYIFKFYAEQVNNAKHDKYKQVNEATFSYHGAAPVKGHTLGDDGITRDEFGWEVTPKTRLPFDDEKVKQMLDYFSGDDRDSWYKMGMALHINYGARSRKGFDLWEEWSKEQDGYADQRDCLTQWKSFKNDKANPITLASFWKKMQEKKTAEVMQDRQITLPETLEDFKDRYVYIDKGSLVGDLLAPVTRDNLTLTEFKLKHKGLMCDIQHEDGRTGKIKEKSVEMTDVWFNSRERREVAVHDTVYHPSSERIFQGVDRGDVQRYYNSYMAPAIEPTDDRDLIPLFLNHLKYLLPNEGDVHWMVNWLAQLIQDPLTRHRVAPLSICTFHGTGRGWLSELMSQLVGRTNVKSISAITEFTRPGAKTGYLDKSTLCHLPETHSTGKEKYSINDRLRNVLGDNEQNVDVKYGSEGQQKIYTRFFFQSNHIDALALDDGDNRIEVFINRAPPKDGAYYTELYRAKNHDNLVDQVYAYLLGQDVDEGLLQASRRTESRQTMIMSGKSATGAAFYDFKLVVDDGLYTEIMMTSFMSTYRTIHSTGSMGNQSEMHKLVQESAVMSTTMSNGLTVSSFNYIEFDKVARADIIKRLNETKSRIRLYLKSTTQKLNERSNDNEQI